MHLIGPLAAGVAGAESGTFSIVQRGTSTPASYYTDFEGLTSPITGTGVALDARGGGIFYVNELVKVTVLSSAGATIREFIAGDAGTCVEVRSDSFTGTHYQTAASAVGNPTTLTNVLNMWNNSAGCEDFKVLIGATKTNLSTAFSALQGQRRYVVTEYGALGNGVANDLSAINSAIAAANAAGGGIVYFPPGTYNISTSMTTFYTVSLEGAGVGLTTIRSTANLMALGGGNRLPVSVKGIKFTYSSGTYANGYVAVASGVTAGDVYRFDECEFTVPTAGTTIFLSVATACTLSFHRCTIASIGTCVSAGNAVNTLELSGCRLVSAAALAAGTISMVIGTGPTRVTNTVLDCSATTSGTLQGFNANGAETMVVTGCAVYPPAASVTSWIQFVAGAGAALVESGNSIRASLNGYAAAYLTYSLNGGGTSRNTSQFGSRAGAKAAPVDSNADPLTAPIAQAGHCSVHVTSTAAHAGNVGVNADALSHTGAQATISVWNDTAGAITFQWGSFINTTGTFSVAANSIRTFHLVCNEGVGGGNSYAWYLVADIAGGELGE